MSSAFNTKVIARRLKKGRPSNTSLDVMFHAQKGRCFYCRLPMTLGDGSRQAASREHVRARSAGGGNERNLVAACIECNQYKADKPIKRFLREIRLSARQALSHHPEGTGS